MDGTFHRTSIQYFCTMNVTVGSKSTTKEKVEKGTFVSSSIQCPVCQVIRPSLLVAMYVSQFLYQEKKKVKLRRKVILATCNMKLIGLANNKYLYQVLFLM